MISREQIVTSIRTQLEPLDYVLSFFEGGSVSFGNDDEYSDMDLVVDADEGRAGDVFEVVESALLTLGPFDSVWRVPEPTWHGYSQRFYHLASASEYLYIDFVVRADGKPPRLNEVEQHGTPQVYFDKTGVTTPVSLDTSGLRDKLRERVTSIRGSLPMMAAFVRKEIARGNDIDAMAFFQMGVLRPLVELARIKYCPLRYSFGLRYLRRDLGQEAALSVMRLSYACNSEDLQVRLRWAEEWFNALLAEIDPDQLDLNPPSAP